MPGCHSRLAGAMFALLLVGGATGCSASVLVGTASTTGAPRSSQPQRPGTCEVAPPEVKIPTGEWTAKETILTTGAIDACAGEHLVRPWDFRQACTAGVCRTYLYTVTYYGTEVAEIAPDGPDRYIATFQPSITPCPHRPGEDNGSNRGYSTLTLWWSSDRKTLHGLSRDHQVGPCGGGPDDTSSYVAERTNPAATPPAEGP